MNQPATESVATSSDRAGTIRQARRRARHVLQTESHASVPSGIASAAAPAAGVVVGTLIVWVALTIGDPGVSVVRIVAAAGLALAISTALIEALRIRARLLHLERELERERIEIRENREHEREEVRVLYEAKGFTDPLLRQVVDTLCADDERLLKVMMHEELGLATEQLEHPLLVGVVTGLLSLGAAASVTAAVAWIPPDLQLVGVPLAGAAWIVLLAWARSRLTDHDFVEGAASWLLAGTAAVGSAYFLTRLAASTG